MSCDEPDVMAQLWYCLTCSETFRFGQIRMRNGGLHCPLCGSENLHPADGGIIELDSYEGEISDLN
jgi:DNA-directed RNA polymerase subunit RPC12/RpoP